MDSLKKKISPIFTLVCFINIYSWQQETVISEHSFKVGCCLVTKSCPTLWDCSTPGLLSFTISWSLLKLMFIESVMPSSHLIFCHPLLLLPSIFHSIRVFSNESAVHIRWPKYWSFSISPSNEYSGLISLRIDWFDLLHVQGILKNRLAWRIKRARHVGRWIQDFPSSLPCYVVCQDFL